MIHIPIVFMGFINQLSYLGGKHSHHPSGRKKLTIRFLRMQARSMDKTYVDILYTYYIYIYVCIIYTYMYIGERHMCIYITIQTHIDKLCIYILCIYIYTLCIYIYCVYILDLYIYIDIDKL